MELKKTVFRSGSYEGRQWGRFWLGVDVRGVEALRVQVEVHFGYLRVDLSRRRGRRRRA